MSLGQAVHIMSQLAPHVFKRGVRGKGSMNRRKNGNVETLAVTVKPRNFGNVETQNASLSNRVGFFIGMPTRDISRSCFVAK